MVDGDRTPAGRAQASERYRRLPEPIRLEDTITTKDADPLPDPDAGRNPDRDFMLRYAGL